MRLRLLIAAFTLLGTLLNAQLYQGPANGSIPSGLVVNTNNFTDAGPEGNFPVKPMKNLFVNSHLPDNARMPAASGPAGSNYTEDQGYNPRLGLHLTGDFSLVRDFNGIPDQGFYIPPDPYLAVGPQHIVGVVNSRFRIFDKQGNILKTIEASSWYNSVLPGADPFDPKVVYDHHNKRWVMVWLNVGTSTAHFLISVSDDSIPTGVWHNWAMSSALNGSTASGNWGDYQGVGFNKDGLFITANQFSFAGSYNYQKLRIIPFTDLYAATPGQVTWKDIWDIRHPGGNEVGFGVRPVLSYSNSSDFYLVARSPFVTGTYFTVYKITNPTTNPVMTAVNVPVTAYSDPDNAGQLGGSTVLEAGGSNLRHEPILRDNKLHFVHSVRSGTGGLYSAVRYLSIDVTNNTVVSDYAQGQDTYWHFYPALAVDPQGNVAITYTRSGTTQYAGAFFTSKPASFAGLTGSRSLKAGNGYYVKTFGGTRNRWGDYNGASVDPATGNVWLLTEYVASTNTWGSWVGELAFSTTAALVAVNQPNGGEVWPISSNQNIVWSSSNVTNVKIEYSTNNGTSWSVVAASVPAATGQYAWNIPNTPSTQCKVRISDASNGAVVDESNGVFTIGAPQGWQSVTSGTSGDIWSISWVDENVVWLSAASGDVKKSTNGGETWSAAGFAAEGAYSVAAIDAQTAVVSTGPSSGNGAIYRTTNGGTNWTQVYTTSGAWFNFVDRLPSGVLWAQSDPIGGTFHIIKSTDNGATWTLTNNRPAAPATNVFGANDSYYSIGDTLWFGTGGASGATLANRVYKSVNGVDGPWTFSTATAQFTGSMAFKSGAGTGLVGFWQVTNQINRSTNGGTTWTAVNATVGSVHGFEFLRGTDFAWAATTTGLFKTTDGGLTWALDEIPAGAFNLNVVRFSPSGNIALSGGSAGLLLRKTGSPVIPVELTSFTASVVEDKVVLNWSTATEFNNRGFEVQKNVNGTWSPVGFVSGNGTTTEISTYSFTDNYRGSNFSGAVSYRLKQTDYDGRYAYSPVTSLTIDFSVSEFALYQNHPNPFNPSTVISFGLPVASDISLKIYDQLGAEVATVAEGAFEAGKHEISFDGSRLSSGVYFYKLQSGSFVQVRKMMMVK
ncbi:MAG: T9SS type A sorting domain-containing protein [Ignavibacteriaceae bacterium]|nr:T9SS type A sorting domain-containing protein [Ignavibacteriaceae bacterium]